MNTARRPRPGRADTGGRSVTYDVRVWKIRAVDGKRARTYEVRWQVDGRERSKSFKTRALAESFRAELLTATRKGAPFDRATGQPVAMLPDSDSRSWYTHACDYVDMKWPNAAANSRRSIAEALATVTPAFLPNGTGVRQPSAAAIRDALYGWAFNATRRAAGEPDGDLVQVATWIERSTLSLAAIADPIVIRRALDTIARKLDGSPAAATTIARKRSVLYNALEYAIERGDLDSNPLEHIKWTAPKALETVDARVVINHDQARALLDAVEAQGDTGRHLKAFFGCMYYAALRPAEVTNLTKAGLDLPTTGWGELHPADSIPAVASDWTDTGRRESRQLKHRARGETRNVPCAPPLTRMLHDHIKEFGIGCDGRIFRGARGGPVPDTVYCAVWREARQRALAPAEIASPLAARPYDLRHAAVSTWLNAGISPTQVAEWAGHSVNVLLRVYAKCIVGQHRAAIRRLAEALDAQDGVP